MEQLCLARCDFEDEACSTLFFFYSLCLLAGGGGRWDWIIFKKVPETRLGDFSLAAVVLK